MIVCKVEKYFKKIREVELKLNKSRRGNRRLSGEPTTGLAATGVFNDSNTMSKTTR